MSVSGFRLVAIWGLIAIGCLVPTSVSADLKLPRSATVLKVDINGNGKLDRVVATYFSRPVLVIDDFKANTCKTTSGKFVRYTMYTDGQKKGRVIFEENYGSTIASYWVHQLEIGKDLNRDGRTDLVFYMGDDTSDETTYLLQKPEGFKAIFAGNVGLPSYQIDTQRSLRSSMGNNSAVWAKWNQTTEIWTSNKYGWVKGNCVAIRERPDPQSKIVALGFDHNLMAISNPQPVGDWISINHDGTKGWINQKYFSFSSPVSWFK
jgi:hypothetical protein